MRSLVSVLAAVLAPLPALAQDTPEIDPNQEAAAGIAQAWGVTYGGYVGGTTGYLAGEALESDESDHIAQGILPGAIVGAGIGGVSSWLMTKQRDLTVDEATWLWTGSGQGVFYGVQLGRAFIPIDADGAQERVHAAGLAGSMAGTGVAFLVDAPDAGAQLHFDLATGIGALAAGGVSDAAGLTLADDQRARAGINLVGAASFGSVAAAYGTFANETPNAGAWGLSLAHGAWLGGWAPYLFTETPDERQVLGGVRAGIGAGYAGALVLASVGNPDPKSVALQGVGITAGNALGAGIPMAVGERATTPSVVGPMLAGSVAGQALGAAIAPHYQLSENDALLLGTLGAWTGYQSAGWAAYATATGQTGTRSLGYALTTGGSGTLLAMGLAPAVDIPASGSAMLLASGGWGTWYGGWTAELLDAGPENGWLMMLGTGDAALLGSAIAQGAGWTPSWSDVGTINGMGMLGAAGGGLVGVIALYDEDDWDPMVGSILIGSTVGLGAGAVMSARGGKASDSGYDLPEIRLGRGTYKPQVTARPWMDEKGQPGVYGEVKLTELGKEL